MQLQFYGTQAMPELVNDTDPCFLESEVVVLYAAAELAPKDSADKDAKLALAKEGLRLAKVRMNSAGDGGTVYTNGGAASRPKPHPRSIVLVGG